MNNKVSQMIEGIFKTLLNPKKVVDVPEIEEEYTQEIIEEEIMAPPIIIEDEPILQDDENDSSYVVEDIIDNPIEQEIQEVETTKVSKHWYHNDTEQILAVECPEGWVPGKLKK